jgi:hypothetical protein
LKTQTLEQISIGFRQDEPTLEMRIVKRRTAVHERYFFHSFARPKVNEAEDETLERSLSILALMKEVGLVLAPEVVSWDITASGGGNQRFSILQKRACFTELALDELLPHSRIFGPISLTVKIAELRAAGATPVIYVPQGLQDSPLSQISSTCAYGAYHTQAVLKQLQGVKEQSDLHIVARLANMPVSPDYELILRNPDAAGNIVAEYHVSAKHVQHVLQHVGFNNMPFDHSVGILSVFLNMFYPTDNAHTGDDLGYYRQREWRLIAGDVNFNGRPLGRSLSADEVKRLEKTDGRFWNRELTIGEVTQRRSALAVIYDPLPGWDFLKSVDAIYAPRHALDRIRDIVGSQPAAYEHPPAP